MVSCFRKHDTIHIEKISIHFLKFVLEKMRWGDTFKIFLIEIFSKILLDNIFFFSEILFFKLQS
jgi:hypothetical protein